MSLILTFCMKSCSRVVRFSDYSTYIPLSGRNAKFNVLISGKPKILVLNKMDMCDSRYKKVVAFRWQLAPKAL